MAHISQNDNASSLPDRLVGARVTDAGGNQASITSIQQSGNEAKAWVQLAEGTQVLVPVGLFVPQEDGVYGLPFTFHFNTQAEAQYPMQMTFPVMEEEVHVAKRVVDTGRGVRVHKTVSEREQVVDQPLLRDELRVEHVPVERVVEEGNLPQVRYEGDTLVVPVFEEVLVVQKQMMLKEEIRITRERQQVQVPQTVLLRSEQISVERFDESRKQ